MDTRLSPSIKIPTNSPSSWQWEAKHTAVSKGCDRIALVGLVSLMTANSSSPRSPERAPVRKSFRESSWKSVSTRLIVVKFQIENTPCFFFFFLIENGIFTIWRENFCDWLYIYIYTCIIYRKKRKKKKGRKKEEKGIERIGEERGRKEKELRQRGDKTNQFSAFYDHSPRSHRVISWLPDRYRAVLRKGRPPSRLTLSEKQSVIVVHYEWRNVKIPLEFPRGRLNGPGRSGSGSSRTDTESEVRARGRDAWRPEKGREGL